MKKLYFFQDHSLPNQPNHLRGSAAADVDSAGRKSPWTGFLLGLLCLLAMLSPGVSFAQTNNYFGTAGTVNGNVWNVAPGGPYTNALVTTGGSILNFNNAGVATWAATPTAVGLNFGAPITWTGGATCGGAGINVAFDVSSGINIVFSAALSGSATATFTKNGLGGLQTAGGTFGGLTLNAGTWIAGGVNATGGAAGNVLTLNGGAITTSTGAARTFAGKHTGGIVVGGNFGLGNVADFPGGTGNLTFDGATSLGAGTSRIINIGGTANYFWNGNISGAGSNVEVTSTSTGVLFFGGTGSTYNGTTTISSGADLRISPTANATFASQVVLNSGTLSTTGITAGRTWTNSSTLKLDANSIIELGSNNHSLTFANSSAVTWAGSTLTINGWTGVGGVAGTGGQIFVGVGGLSGGQLAKVVFTGFPGLAQILPSGELVPAGAVAAAITPSVSALTGLDYVVGSGPSTSQSFTIAASNLTPGPGNITIDATLSPNYEVSVTSPGVAGFAASVTLPYTGTGTLANNTIWVRLKSGLGIANYDLQAIALSGGSATNSIDASGSVSPLPYMSLTALNTATTENMDVMGVAPATNTIVSTPTGFRAGTDWTTGTTVNTVAGGVTGAGTISAGGFYNFADGINASATDRGLGYLFSGGFSSPRSIVLRFQNNTGSTVRQLDVAFDYEKYRNGQITLTNTFTHGATTTPAIAESAGDQVYTTDGNNNLLNPATTISKAFSLYGLSIPNGGDYYFMWTFTGSASTNAIATGIDNFSVTPRDKSLVTSVSSLTGFNYTGAGPSAEQIFTISGDNLSTNVVISPPAAYEVSFTSGAGFVANPGNIFVAPVAGNIPGQPRNVYVRLKAGLPGGLYNGQDIVLTSGVTITKTVTLDGGVVPAVNLSASANVGTEFGTTVITLTATASTAVSGAQTMNVGISGAGITGGDYSLAGATLSGNTLTILNGNTTAQFTFTITNDALNEGAETASITISGPSAGIIIGATDNQDVAITDDDDAIYLNVLNTSEPAVTFDDMANTGTTNTLTIKGAYMFELTGNTTYAADNGSSNSGNTFSYGSAAATDRALGSLASGGNSQLHVGLKLRNNTGGNMNALDISYVGEQWRCGGNTSVDVLFFEYSTDATDLNSGTWNTINSLNMNSVINTAGVQVLDGNNPANQSAISGTVGLGTITDGTSFWIRWRDMNQGGNDHGMGVDDVVMKPRFITPAIFYSKSSGDLNVLGTWGDNPDGSGNVPTNFTTAGQIFTIANQAAATISANWAVTGATAKVIVGDGVAVTQFTAPSGFSFTTGGGSTVDVSALGELILNHPSTPTFGTIDANSSVTFGASSGTQNVDATNYGNLSFVGAGTKNILGVTGVAGNLVFDGADMNKSAAGFVNINYAGNITILSACTYQAGFKTNVNLATTGNGVQVVTGNGHTLSCSQFNSTKTAGSLSLSTVGGSTTINPQDDIRMILSGAATFTDNGNLLSVGGDFETAGSASNYVLTGTLQMDGFPAGQVNIRQDVGGAAGAAEINHLIINLANTDQFNFQPIGAGSGQTTINGNLTIQGSSSYTNKIRFGGTGSPSGVILKGNYSNTLNADVIYSTAGTIEFNGSAAQTFTTAYTGADNFFDVIINNAAGVTMTAGDFRINGAGDLNCSVGVLTTGVNKVILSNTATITETASSHVIGFVQSTRNIGLTTNQTFGGMGLEINAAGASNSTVVLRQTGTSTIMGCPAASIKRNYTVTPTVNAALNATVVFHYFPSVAELNGINENLLNLFNLGGTLVSNLSVLDEPGDKITLAGQPTLAASYTASIPGPTLGSVTMANAYTCNGSTETVNLAGLLAGGTFTVNYTIGGVAQTPIAGLVADGAGAGSFTSPALTMSQNGQDLVITNLTQTPVSCSPPLGNLATLDVRARPSVSISANDFVCKDQTAPINFFFTGASPWNFQYTIDAGPTLTPPAQIASPFTTSYAPVTFTNRAYEITTLTDANCTAIGIDLATFNITVPNPCSITWKGITSDWTDANNWVPNNSAPSVFTSVNIPKVNIPFVQPSISGLANCANVNLSNIPTINISAGNQLDIRGDVTGGIGGKIEGLGKVVFAGTGLQNIYGRVIMSNVDFGNFSAQGVVVTPDATFEIRPTTATGTGLLTILNNSRFTNNGKFILGSNAVATAKIGPVPATFTLTGDVTMERYLPYTGGAGSWNFIGSPFCGTSNFTDWVDNFKVVGLNTGFGTQGGGIINSNEPERSTIFKYDEPTHDTRLDTVQKQGWRIPGNETLTQGAGYRVWVDHNSNGTHKFDNTGPFVFGDFMFPQLKRTELAGCIPASFPCDEPSLRGWNLLSNPYPCDIDWDAASPAIWNKPADMSDAWYRWHASANGYGVYTTGIYAGTVPAPSNPNLIPSSQAFFVRLSTAGTYNANLSVKEGAKSIVNSGQYLRTNSSVEKIRINISKPGEIHGYDAVIRFMDGATDGYDLTYDFASLGGSGFNLAVPVENQSMSIASYPVITDSKVIGLQTNFAGQFGAFTLKFTETQSLLENNSVFLRDNLLGTLTPVFEGSVYSFSCSPFDGLFASRFELVFNPESTTAVNQTLDGKQSLAVYPNPSLTQSTVSVVLNGFEGKDANLTITDVLGRVVVTKVVELNPVGQTLVNLTENLSSGVYTINAKGNSQSLTQKMIVK